MSGNNEQHLDIDPCEKQTTVEELLAKVEQLELEKNVAVAAAAKALALVAEAGASPATPVSAKKIIYTEAMHKITHAKVVALTAPALLELKKLENNYEAVWWCAKHIEALGKGDRPDGFDKYVAWAGDVKRAALKEYIPLVAGSPAAGSP
jgi:hypothetical protein